MIDDAAQPTGGAAAPAPPVGAATRSRRLSEIADEYRAVYAAANFRDERRTSIDRVADRMIAFRTRYEQASDQSPIPWYFVAAVHALEASFNFGRHLHNGDPLSARTTRVPPGRPTADDGDPPFSWAESARDALTFKNLHTRTDWSLPALLFQLERYNGFGYRNKGLASPYLWSFSDRYIKGKYVADGQFDADAVSQQCGAAVVLKRLEERGEIEIPR